MTPAERLQAAADRLETLDDESTQGPWTVGRSQIDDTVVRFREAELAVVFMDADARLIAALRPLAPLTTTWLREQATDMDRHLAYECKRNEHCTPECGLSYLPTADPRCTHYDHALALADAILGGDR